MIDQAANRLYYAVFQAVLYSVARKRTKNIDVDLASRASKHSRMAKAVGDEGMASDEFQAVFEDLMSLRETADYELEPVSEDELRELVQKAELIRNWWAYTRLGKSR